MFLDSWRSQRRKILLKKKFVLETCPSEAKQGRLFETRPEDVRATFYHPRIYNRKTTKAQEDADCSKVMASTQVGLYSVHADCAVLSHMYNLKDTAGARPYAYIGCSKLSCRACGAYFNAFNKISSRQFSARGPLEAVCRLDVWQLARRGEGCDCAAADGGRTAQRDRSGYEGTSRWVKVI